MGSVSTIHGGSRFVLLLGHPVLQVKSPEPMNKWFAANSLDNVILPVDIMPERLPSLVEAVRGMGNCAGLSVTMPHKQSVFQLIDDVSDRARRARAVNVVRRHEDGRLFGDMLDGLAMVSALKGNGAKVTGRPVLVIGAGGAGAAIIDALSAAKAGKIMIKEPDIEKAQTVASACRIEYPEVTYEINPNGDLQVDVAVNASPMGMHHDDPHPYPLDGLKGVRLIADAVTKPEVTPWLKSAGDRGIAIQRGAEMTKAQLQMQVDFWGLGRDEASVF